jgi:hypothetical protein
VREREVRRRRWWLKVLEEQNVFSFSSGFSSHSFLYFAFGDLMA